MSVGSTSEESFGISSRMVKVLRHVPELRGRDGAIPKKTQVKEVSNGFDPSENWKHV